LLLLLPTRAGKGPRAVRRNLPPVRHACAWPESSKFNEMLNKPVISRLLGSWKSFNQHNIIHQRFLHHVMIPSRWQACTTRFRMAGSTWPSMLLPAPWSASQRVTWWRLKEQAACIGLQKSLFSIRMSSAAPASKSHLATWRWPWQPAALQSPVKAALGANGRGCAVLPEEAAHTQLSRKRGFIHGRARFHYRSQIHHSRLPEIRSRIRKHASTRRAPRKICENSTWRHGGRRA